MDWKKYKIEAILGLTLFIGFILRIINSNTRIVYGDPAHFIVNAINFLSSGLMSLWDQSAFLWYAMTDIFYKIFGITQFASRFSSILFGTLTILAIYLFAKEFFNSKRIALISAMLYSLAPIFIFNAADEHDITLIFFIIMSFYCLIKALKSNSKNYFIFSAIFFGLGGVLKAYMPLLAFPYVCFILYYHYTKRFNIFQNYKTLIVIPIIILLIVSPTIVYNYLNYQHNEVSTFFFTKFFKLYNDKVEDLYGWVAGGDLHKSLSISSIFVKTTHLPSSGSFYPGWWAGIREMMYQQSPWLFFIGILSLIFLFLRRKDINAKDYLFFFAFYFIVPFLITVDSAMLNKHYVHFFAFILPAIAYLFSNAYDYLTKNNSTKNLINNNIYIIYFAIIILLFFSIWSMPFGANRELLFSKNQEGQFISYKQQNIPENSLIIYDDRLYNSMAGWLFNDRYYLPVSYLDEFTSYNKNSSYTQKVPLYIVECAVDQCSWPTTPEVNASMEKFFDYVKSQDLSTSVIYGKFSARYYNPFISEAKKEDYFIIYKSTMDVDVNLLKQIKAQYSYFLYPLNYANKQESTFRNFVYSPSGFFENLINECARIIFYIDIILAFASILFILYRIYDDL